jgi:hypothetical protein
MRWHNPVIALLLLALLALLAGPAAGQEEKTVYKMGLMLHEKRQKKHLDDQVLDAASTAFADSRRFIVVERSELNRVLTEKSLQSFLGKGNAKLSDLLGLDFIGLVSFSAETRTVKDKKFEVFIIDVRLVDVKTGQVLLTLTSDRPELIVPASNEREAGRHLLHAIRGSFPPLGTVVQITAKEVVVDFGSDAGLKDGDVLEIVREGEQIIHHAKGTVVHAPPVVIGELKVFATAPLSARCRIKSAKGGQEAVQVADLVRLKEKNAWLRKQVEKVRPLIDFNSD